MLQLKLERHGYAPILRRVATKGDFLAALRDRSWDAVVSDYSLPQFTGLEALKLLRSRGFDIPCIMISGVLGEEMAVAMMKAGANDYVMKPQLSRLLPALQRELDAAQDRRLHKRAENAMRHLAALVESSEDAIYSQDLDTRVMGWKNDGRLCLHSRRQVVSSPRLLDCLFLSRHGESSSEFSSMMI